MPKHLLPLDDELARAYVPVQVYDVKYSLAEALEKGTLFPELWQPFRRRRGENE